MNDEQRCSGEVTEPGGMGFNRHRCTRQGTIQVSYIGHALGIPLFRRRGRDISDMEVDRQWTARLAWFCKSHYVRFARKTNYYKNQKVLSGDVPPPELPSRRWKFEFQVEAVVYAKTEEEARKSMTRKGLIYPTSKAKLVEVV